MLITLAPHDRSRRRRAPEIIAQPPAAARQAVPGITLYLQPVQGRTIEDRASRTQFQFIMEDPDANRTQRWVPRLIDRLKKRARVGMRGQRPAGPWAWRRFSTSTSMPPGGLASAWRRSTMPSTTLSASG